MNVRLTSMMVAEQSVFPLVWAGITNTIGNGRPRYNLRIYIRQEILTLTSDNE